MSKPVGVVNWKKTEEDIIREFYPKEGSAVSARLSGRSAEACRHRASKLKILGPRAASWTREEDKLLREYYPREGKRAAKRFSNRTAAACVRRAIVLGIKRNAEKFPIYNTWSPAELEILREWYPSEGARVQKRLPWHTKQAIQQFAHREGISYVPKRLRTSQPS